MPSEKGLDALIQFARLASEAGTGARILPLLADALVEQVGAGAVAIIEMQESGDTRLVPSPHTPAELAGVAVDSDALGSELAPAFLAACGGRFTRVESRPLVTGGGLFGTAVMLFGHDPGERHLAVADGLIDLPEPHTMYLTPWNVDAAVPANGFRHGPLECRSRPRRIGQPRRGAERVSRRPRSGVELSRGGISSISPEPDVEQHGTTALGPGAIVPSLEQSHGALDLR